MHHQQDSGRGYKRPESVLVVVYTIKGEALLLKRRDPPDFWQSVTGSLRRDEMPEHAAKRELAEETGMNGVPVATNVTRSFEVAPPWSSRFPPGTAHNTEHEFRFQLPDRAPVRINPAEHEDFVWASWSEAVDRVSSWTNRAALVQLAAERGWMC